MKATEKGVQYHNVDLTMFEASQLKEREVVKFFGLVRKKIYLKNNNLAVDLKFLYGLLSYREESNSWEINIFGLTFFSVKRRKRVVAKLLGIPLTFFDRSQRFYSDFTHCLDSVKLKSTHVILIRHNIGESVCYLGQFANWVRKKNIEDATLIIWRKKDINLIKLFSSQVRCCGYIDISQSDVNSFFRKECLKIGKYTVHCPTFRIAEEMKSIHKQGIEVNFYDFILNSMDLDRSFIFTKPSVPPSTIEKANQFLLDNGIDDNNFILLCPEATSLKKVAPFFWKELIKHLQKEGYSIVINNIYGNYQQNSCIRCSLPIDQLYALGTLSKGIISLGSGLGVLMAFTGQKVDLIYTDFRSKSIGYSAELTETIYSVFHLPNIDRSIVSEWTYNKNSSHQLISKILPKYIRD